MIIMRMIVIRARKHWEQGPRKYLRKESIEINLKEQEIVFGNKRIKFEIDPFKKKCLLDGLDDISISLEKSEDQCFYRDLKVG